MQTDRCKTSPIAHRGIRSALTGRQLSKLESASGQESFQAGELIFKEGDRPAHYFIVISGVLKLTKIDPDGERHIVALMFPGDLLCGTFQPRQTCSAEAATDLKVCAMALETIQDLLDEAPKFERVLLQAATHQLEACQEWMLLLRGCPAYQRVAGFLYLLGKRAQPRIDFAQQHGAVPLRFTLPLSRAEIASFLGITVETVSRQMTLMRKHAVIELPPCRDYREVIVSDIWLLAEHATGSASCRSASSVAPPAFAYPASWLSAGVQ